MVLVELKNIKADDLLKEINVLIGLNRIQTWEYDSMGDYTMNPPQWRKQAWMRFQKEAGNKIKFGIVQRRDVNLSKEVYAVYHGRFTEMLLAHFDDHIISIEVSSMLVRDIDIY